MRKIFFLTAFTFLYSLSATFAQSAPAGAGLEWKLPPITDPAIQARADRLYLATERQAHYLLGQVHPWAEEPSLLILGSSTSNEHSIRPIAGTAAGLAFLYRFGPYDEKIVGVSRAALLNEKLVPMIRYLTATHVTGSRPTSDGKKWGDAWQSALWADSLAMAGWWLGRDLPADLAAEVRRVVAHEADRFVDLAPPHQLKEDTKAEENAWNCQILSAAVLLMPGDARRARWERTFQKWAFSSFLRPADEHAATVIDGRPVSDQFTGANIYDDFTLENHGIVHPDYMTTWSLTAGCSLDFLVTGRQPPQALLYNTAGIYENLKWFTLPDGGFVYPSGQDWAVFRQVDWLHMNLLAAVFAHDPEGWALLDRSLDVLDKMQARSPDGAVYLPEENFFASAQADRVWQLANGWLSLHFASPTEPKQPVREGVRRLESARIVINRTPSAVHAFSWGTRIMAQCMPVQEDRLISPHERSGVGFVRLKGEKEVLPASLVDARVENDEKSFTAEVSVDHGKNAVRSHLRIRSNPDGTFTIAEKLVALRDITTTDVVTGLIGILNDKRWIYERGERAVAIGDERQAVASCSGKLLQGEGVRRVDVDSVLQIASPGPLSVRYQAATQPERSRVTDELYLNSIVGERQWKAGQMISDWQATIRCEPRDKE